MMIQNRDIFLQNLADNLGRPVRTKVQRPQWKHLPQHEVHKDATKDELLDVLKIQCANIHTKCFTTTVADLPATLTQVVEEFGGESVVAWKDERFAQFGLTATFADWKQKQMEVYEWDATNHAENIRQAEKANIGIAISEITLAESASAVLYSGADRGRTMNFLPEKSIVLIPKSTLVPRFTQAARHLHEQVARGEQVPSCILVMTGPSNSADIEMVLIVGVHGPVKATYIVIDDL